MVTEEEMKDFAAGRKLLLLEDNEINAMIAQAQLKSVGFEVEWVVDGAKGFEAYMASDENHYSCIITDMMMPVMDGPETAKRVRKSGRNDADIPILAITANSYAGRMDSIQNCGINKCILKPYKKNELLQWVYDNVLSYENRSALAE